MAGVRALQPPGTYRWFRKNAPPPVFCTAWVMVPADVQFAWLLLPSSVVLASIGRWGMAGRAAMAPPASAWALRTTARASAPSPTKSLLMIPPSFDATDHAV